MVKAKSMLDKQLEFLVEDEELIDFLIDQHQSTALYYRREMYFYQHQANNGGFGEEVKVKAEANRKLFVMHTKSLELAKKLKALLPK